MTLSRIAPLADPMQVFVFQGITENEMGEQISRSVLTKIGNNCDLPWTQAQIQVYNHLSILIASEERWPNLLSKVSPKQAEESVSVNCD